jgi:hypothetical protein
MKRTKMTPRKTSKTSLFLLVKFYLVFILLSVVRMTAKARKQKNQNETKSQISEGWTDRNL